MPVLTPAVSAWQWQAQVLAFAAQHQLETYLDPLLQATRQLFPAAKTLRVFLEDDPEIRDDKHIVFEVQVHVQDAPDYVQAVHGWTDELYRICPAARDGTFRLTLLRVAT